MKSGKAVGPDDIPVEVWKCLGEAAVKFLTSLFNRVLESERMPEEWRRSVLVPIFKNKGDVQSCSNYRGIKLMSHAMKLWERVVEARLRKVVEICEQQYGFIPRKSTTDAIFALRILMEKYRDGQRELRCVFVDLEKAYDRVPREELWYCMRKSGVAEKYVRVVQDMYERSRTVVRCAVGQTEEFKVEVGLHQGSALSPFLFAIVMDQLSEEVRQESPWTMMFADDIVICSESKEQVEENLERWRFVLERRGMKVSRSKTEYMCVNEREGSGTVRLQGEEVKKVQEFKYLGSTVQSNGECGKEVKKRVQAGCNGWRKVLGVLCDRKISARIKGKVYRTVVRPAMLYGLETVSLSKRQESELEVAELKMLRFSLGVTRLDRIRNEYIRETAHVGRLGDKVREARLRWFGHVQRRESVLNGAQLGAGELLQHRLRCGEVDAALGILGNMDWCMMGADCYRGLISLTDHLLRKPLDEQTEAQLEAALGMFYSPSRALTDTVILEYRDPISRYVRRFFHHLLRHQRFEKAFLLALDIGARDLFMDLHYVARDSGEPVLADVARRKAQELDAEGVVTFDPDQPKPALREQNGVCVSPVNTHTEWTVPSKAYKNTRVASKGKMDRKMEEDLSETMVNPAVWPWTQTEFTLGDRNDQVSKDSGELKVIHFGLV
ncbi:hypothetical protein QTP70_030292 [Hemibagrus guttatus]|uniref:ribonuclease H n=1 Tax=Hemibagrus guttatus TaxID=175788 RepID=A0AAE0R0N8_9TELE|nr:hypothetical protein QTP70_030292 [Hemibagrus guttatus]